MGEDFSLAGKARGRSTKTLPEAHGRDGGCGKEDPSQQRGTGGTQPKEVPARSAHRHKDDPDQYDQTRLRSCSRAPRNRTTEASGPLRQVVRLEQLEKPVEELHGGRRTSGDVEIDWENL